MQCQKFDLGAYNLHVIKTKKFRTVNVEINFRRPITREEITYRNFLMDMLVYSTKRYPTKRDLALCSEELYETKVQTLNSRMGNFVNSSIQMQFLNENFTEEGMFSKSMDLLMEILFHPNVENEMFDQTAFDLVKLNLENEIKSVKDNPLLYSIARMLESMGPDENYALRGYGYLDTLELITPNNLYQYYQNMMKQDEIDIFILGDVDVSEIKQYIKDHFEVNTKKTPKGSIYVDHKNIRKKEIVVVEEEDIVQSKLTIGCKLVGLTPFERQYVLPCYAEILGGTGTSKLFKVIREEHSLAYYIHATPRTIDNLLLIYSGISGKDMDQVVELTRQQMDEVTQGKFSDQFLQNSKQEFLSSLTTVMDSPSQIINIAFSNEVLKTDPIEKRKKEVNKVTKKDVVELSKKIQFDTIYLMGERGISNGEEGNQAS